MTLILIKFIHDKKEAVRDIFYDYKVLRTNLVL